MQPLTDLVDRYFAAWNETDAPRRRALLERTWTDDAAYVDPLGHADGVDGINAMIAAVQAQFPGCRLRRTSDVDAHNAFVRFAWEMAPDGAEPVAGGVDFGQVVGDRLHAITGFLDFAPGAAAS